MALAFGLSKRSEHGGGQHPRKHGRPNLTPGSKVAHASDLKRRRSCPTRKVAAAVSPDFERRHLMEEWEAELSVQPASNSDGLYMG